MTISHGIWVGHVIGRCIPTDNFVSHPNSCNTLRARAQNGLQRRLAPVSSSHKASSCSSRYVWFFPSVPLRTFGINPLQARRSNTNFAYVPGGRTFTLSLPQHLLSFSDFLAIYKGTVNDPTTFPPPSKSHGSYHWSFERLLAAGLVPLTTAAFVTSGSPAPLLDGLLGVSLIVHSHIGVRVFFSLLQACIG